MKEEPIQGFDSPLTSQRPELRKASFRKMVVPPGTLSRLSPHVANAIEAETLRQEGDTGEISSFFIADLRRAVMAVHEWRKRLPDVHPFYAMKCNPDAEMIKQLVALDVGIDCASLGEMECALGLGALPERIIYTNPIKTPASLETARILGARTLVFDNVEELLKIKKWIPDAKLLLRIEADDASAKINFSSKFGASLDSAGSLIKLASKLDMYVAGICFHIGTGAKDPRAFTRAVHNAIDIAQRSNLDLRLLDLGGGFSSSNFASFTEHLQTAISYAKHVFPRVQVIAEPGRYLACSSFTICCQVIGRRAEADPPRLYVNDGVYGNFMNAIMEQEKYQPVAIVRRGRLHDQDHTGNRVYSIWGQTCDSVDRIAVAACFDREVRIEDWLVFADMGAYTSACQTGFNGFDARGTRTLYVE